MVRKRRPENKGLPNRWRHTHGGYYYQVPPGLEAMWDGKKTYRLGKTLHEAYQTWTKKIGTLDKAKNYDQLFDRYLLEVVPKKKPATQRRDRQHIARLRPVFGASHPAMTTPQDIYIYVDRRSKKVTQEKDGKIIVTGGARTAHHEVACLSHVCTKAVEWGVIPKHPFKGEVRLEGLADRDRYIEDWEIIECLALPTERKKGSVLMIQAYIRLKLLTGMRETDMLLLKMSDIKEDGINLDTSKTGKASVYVWSDELRAAVEMAKKARPVDIGPYLFCNKYGEPYFVEETGQAQSWWSIWGRFMTRVLKETKVTERFTEHDLRAKCASDAETLEHARALLAHADARTTRRIYRRKREKVQPLR